MVEKVLKTFEKQTFKCGIEQISLGNLSAKKRIHRHHCCIQTQSFLIDNKMEKANVQQNIQKRKKEQRLHLIYIFSSYIVCGVVNSLLPIVEYMRT